MNTKRKYVPKRYSLSKRNIPKETSLIFVLKKYHIFKFIKVNYLYFSIYLFSKKFNIN